MKPTSTERRIRRAMEHAAPPMSETLSAAASRKETIHTMEQRKTKRTNTVAGERHRSGQKSRKGVSTVTAILASAAAVVILFAGITLFQGRNAVQSRITLDVNPSLAIDVDKKERVLVVEPLNAEAQDVIGTMDFAGAQLEVTVNALVGAMLQKGYLDVNSNAILVSVEDGDPQHAEALQTRISETINAAFGGGEAAVLTQTLTTSETAASEAEAYGISEGKAALIRSIVAQDPTLTFEKLAPLGVQEIALIAKSRDLQAEGVKQTGTANDGGYIGIEAAKNAAFSHAGVAADAVTAVESELDREDGVMVYEIEFYHNDTEYDYEIDAATGAVRKAENETGKQAPAVIAAASAAAEVSEAEAKKIALDHAGVKESEASNLYIKLDRDDGRLEYEVKFFVGSTEYDYEIDAATGAVKKAEIEGSKQTSNGAADASADIGADRAKAIALAHAGLTEAGVQRLKAERDREDGVLVYEVEFRDGDMEYEYEIDAATGAIRKAEKERDD